MKTVEEILKRIKENTNYQHYVFIKDFCYRAFEQKYLRGYSKWSVKRIDELYPELTNHKDLDKEVYDVIKEKIEFCNESL